MTAEGRVYIDDVFVPDDYVVGELKGPSTSPRPSTSTLHPVTYSPIAQRLDLLTEYVSTPPATESPEGRRVARPAIAQLHTQAEVARVIGLKFVFASSRGGAPPTSEASESSCSPESSRRWPTPRWALVEPGGQLRCAPRTPDGGPGRVDLSRRAG